MSDITQDTPRQKSAGSIIFSLGLFSLSAEFVPVEKPNTAKAVSFKSICPDCLPDPVAPKQLYRCTAGHEHPVGELAKAREIGKVLVPVSDMEVKAIQGEQVTGVLDLHSCSAEDLEAATLPGDKTYRIRPDARNVQNYGIMLDLASDPTIALYGVAKLNARSVPTAYRLGVSRGQLVMRALLRPENIAPTDKIEVTVDPKLAAMARALVEQIREPFDPTLLADDRVQRLADVVDAKLVGVAPVLPEAQPEPVSDLMAMLEASLKATAS